MAFRARRKAPQFADLKAILAQSKEVDTSLYQVVEEIINRLAQFQFAETIAVPISGGGGTGGTGGANKYATFHTKQDDRAVLPNSVQLLAGAGIQFDDSIPNKRTINDISATLPPLPHAPTHTDGASDSVNVTNLGGFPGGDQRFLRADRTFAVPPNDGGVEGGMNLDYLGDFVSGPEYVDGDIVIAADGIAYMCVVDGTTTPPEPWPGVGVSVNPIVDASYWVAHHHPQLVAERALDSLTNGYVRNNFGEPSPIYPIPFSDTSGTVPDNRLTSNVALKNINNNFVAQTLASFSMINGTYSALLFNDTAAPVDVKVWRMLNYNNGNFYLEAMNDDSSAIQTQFSFARTGILTAVGFNGALNASQINAGRVPSIHGGVPTGMIGMFAVACPPGWTRLSAMDGRFPRAWPVYGAIGGAGSHSHTVTGTVASHTHLAAGLTMPWHNHGGAVAGTTEAGGDHSHSVSQFGTFGPSNSVGGDSGSGISAATSGHTHAVPDHNTNNGGYHAHNFSAGIPWDYGQPIDGVTSAAAPALSGATNSVDHHPFFFDVVMCHKD
jgi:hypothetical protein